MWVRRKRLGWEGWISAGIGLLGVAILLGAKLWTDSSFKHWQQIIADKIDGACGFNLQGVRETCPSCGRTAQQPV